MISDERASPGVGSFICLSKIHCTHILGLQVAVAVDLGGHPLGKKDLRLLISVSVASVSGTSGVTGTLEAIGTSFSFLSDEVAIGPSAMVPLLLSCTAAKNCQVDAITSSLLASVVL